MYCWFAAKFWIISLCLNAGNVGTFLCSPWGLLFFVESSLYESMIHILSRKTVAYISCMKWRLDHFLFLRTFFAPPTAFHRPTRVRSRCSEAVPLMCRYGRLKESEGERKGWWWIKLRRGGRELPLSTREWNINGESGREKERRWSGDRRSDNMKRDERGGKNDIKGTEGKAKLGGGGERKGVQEGEKYSSLRGEHASPFPCCLGEGERKMEREMDGA